MISPGEQPADAAGAGAHLPVFHPAPGAVPALRRERLGGEAQGPGEGLAGAGVMSGYPAG